MKRQKNKSLSGFTLLEVVITIGIFTMIISYFMAYFSHEIRQYYTKENLIEFKQDARIALDRIVTKIRFYNGLVVAIREDGTVSTITDENGVVIINTDADASSGEIRYAYDSTKGFGELRDASENKIVGNIKQLVIRKDPLNEQLLLVEISCGNNKTEDVKDYATAVRLH